jgi:hypothetical protein
MKGAAIPEFEREIAEYTADTQGDTVPQDGELNSRPG